MVINNKIKKIKKELSNIITEFITKVIHKKIKISLIEEVMNISLKINELLNFDLFAIGIKKDKFKLITITNKSIASEELIKYCTPVFKQMCPASEPDFEIELVENLTLNPGSPIKNLNLTSDFAFPIFGAEDTHGGFIIGSCEAKLSFSEIQPLIFELTKFSEAIGIIMDAESTYKFKTESEKLKKITEKQKQELEEQKQRYNDLQDFIKFAFSPAPLILHENILKKFVDNFPHSDFHAIHIFDEKSNTIFKKFMPYLFKSIADEIELIAQNLKLEEASYKKEDYYVRTFLISSHLNFKYKAVLSMISTEPLQLSQYVKNKIKDFCAQCAYALDIENLLFRDRDRQKMLQEMEIAKSIQEQMFPEQKFVFNNLNIYARTIPATNVGGDLYIIHKRQNELIAGIADISGKGIPAAMLAGLVKTHTIRSLEEKTINKNKLKELITTLSKSKASESDLLKIITDYQDIKEVIFNLNNYLVKEIDDYKFVTMGLFSIDSITGKFSFVNCGHLPPIILRSNNMLESLDLPAPPLGIKVNIEFNTIKGKLLKNDILILYSDGITEAKNNKNDIFKEESLKNILIGGIENQTPLEIFTYILNKIKEFRKAQPQNDDITLVVIKKEE